ncbi:hypothetical protein H5410_013985 [Solanum commersonii]|uniref:Uncharacterized protein n=1 Tax=Solanum commersonii TaxID=4109 RepID=A0A9J5ZPQ8_SOLCO|nr:hypothetical protein H5410_013985 [Solanum commersonii]
MKARVKKRIKNLSRIKRLSLEGIDKGFEDIFKNKAAKYIGRLGGNEEFIGSSDEPSEDSDEELDVLAQPVLIYLEEKAKIECIEFRKAIADYGVKRRVLIQFVDGLLPNVERRMCARHIWANWQKTWRGEARRKAFWRCSKASFEVKLSDQFAYLGQLGDNICESLLKYNKKYWCRAFFSERTKCDVVENNMCETFNSWIVGPRHKSVISMLEDIRHKMMDRHGDMIKFVDTWISDISPMARLTLEINKEIGRKLKVNWNHDLWI